MIINIDTPNPIPTNHSFYPMCNEIGWTLTEHQVAFLHLDKIFPTWNSLIKGKNLQQLVYDRLWKIQ